MTTIPEYRELVAVVILHKENNHTCTTSTLHTSHKIRNCVMRKVKCRKLMFNGG